MRLLRSFGAWAARRWVDQARKGKKGEGMGKLLGFLDGRKRYLLLIVFAAQAIAQLMGSGDIMEVTRALLAIVGWDASDAVVSSAVVGQLVASTWAILDGIRKDRQKRRGPARPQPYMGLVVLLLVPILATMACVPAPPAPPRPAETGEAQGARPTTYVYVRTSFAPLTLSTGEVRFVNPAEVVQLEGLPYGPGPTVLHMADGELIHVALNVRQVAAILRVDVWVETAPG